MANKNNLEGSDPRRLIKFGNASYVVSLPSAWVKENRLNKGDLVYLERNSNNELILQPKATPKPESREVTIDVNGKRLRSIRREVTSAYTRGYDVIILTGKSLHLNSDSINDIVGSKVGAELLGSKRGKVVIKVSLDEKKISLIEMVRRMNNLINLMMESLIKQILVGKNNKKYYNEIHEIDKDVNRIFFLMWRMVDYYLLAKRLPAEKLPKENFNFSNLSDLRWVATNLEYVGDELKRISRFIMKAKLKKEQAKSLKDTLGKIGDMYGGVMQAFQKDDTSKAFIFTERKLKLLKECDAISNKSREIVVGKITEKMKDMVGYIHHIAKLVIY